MPISISSPIHAALFTRIAATFVTLICTSCIVVPVGVVTKSPYNPEVVRKLSQQSADRNLVRQTLGTPDLTKARGQYWFYANSREMWGIIGGSSSAVITDEEWLAVRFDETGHVIFVEYNKLKKCLSNGLCFDGSAPTADDNAAKTHAVKPDECAVYLFLDQLPWPLATGIVKYRVDGKPIGMVNAKTYLFLTHAAGVIEIAAYDLRISMHCPGGGKIYVSAVKKRDFSWETGEDLAPRSAVEGAAAILERRLALPD